MNPPRVWRIDLAESLERPECGEHRSVGIVSIPTAGIRQDIHRAVSQGFVLKSEADPSGLVVLKQGAIDRDPEQGDRVGAIVCHYDHESLQASCIFPRCEHIDSCTGSLNDVCEAESPIRKAPIVLVGQWLRYQLRVEQEFPETGGVTGEVMSGSC